MEDQTKQLGALGRYCWFLFTNPCSQMVGVLGGFYSIKQNFDP